MNNNFLDTYQLKSQNAVLDGTIERIARREDGGYRIDFRYARTVEATAPARLRPGHRCAPASASTPRIFDAVGPAPAGHQRPLPRADPAYESVNVPGLYFAGTLTQQRDFKRSTSGFIHGFRYGIRALHRILGARLPRTPWPATTLDATPEAITDAIIARINRTSALWQQFGVLGDVVTVDGDTALLPRGGAGRLPARRRSRAAGRSPS